MLPPVDSATAPDYGASDSARTGETRSVPAVDRRQFLGGRWLRRPAPPAPAAKAAVRIAVRARPAHLADTMALIATIDGATLHSSDPRGLMVVAAVAARADAVLLALHHMPHVLSAALVTAAEDFSS